MDKGRDAMTDTEKRMRAWCDAQRGGNHKGGCDVCDEVMARLAKGVCVTNEQDSMRKKAGCRSALSHACDLQRVCDTRADTHERHPGDETHTATHTDDATT